MRFVASADWQLGMTAGFLGEEARPRYADARLTAVRRIGRIAAERSAAFVVVAGDVFEHNLLDPQHVMRVFDVLKDFTVPVYLLPGNHDPLDAGSIYTSARFVEHRPAHVHVLDRTGVVEVMPGVEIVAAPWPHKRPLIDLVGRACAELEPADDVIRIVVGHGAVDTLQPDAASVSTIDTAGLRGALDAGRIHFVVLGDRHSTTEVDDRIWYPGTPEVTSRREDDPGNVLVVDADASGAQVEAVPTGSWTFSVEQRALNSSSDLDVLGGWLDAQIHKERTAVWLVLSGTLSVTQKARLDDLLDDARLLYAQLSIWERHDDLHVIADDTDFSDLGLTGFADEAVTELRAMAGADGDDGTDARNALAQLVRLSGGVR